MTRSHHLLTIGALGVAALYLVQYLYPGQLLYYTGPGNPHWLYAILVVWHLGFGICFGIGVIGVVLTWVSRITNS